MLYPVNYDFGANWKTKIVPHLDKLKVKKAVRDGVNGYLSCWDNKDRYKANTCPANYSSKDGYAMLMMRKGDLYFEQLEKEGKLPKKYVKLKNSIHDEDDDDYHEQLFFMKQEIKESIYAWNKIKYDLESYYLSGSCHWYAPTFEWTLATLVEPKEKWTIRSSDKHTTVINKEHTKVFDLLYWANDDRLEHYVFGDPITNPDPTLGGKQAYLDSDEANEDNRDKDD